MRNILPFLNAENLVLRKWPCKENLTTPIKRKKILPEQTRDILFDKSCAPGWT